MKPTLLQYSLAVSLLIVLLRIIGISYVYVGGIATVDLLAGFALLGAISGMSTFSSYIPATLIGFAWGIGGSTPFLLPACALTLIFTANSYELWCIACPLSPWNVYRSVALGAIIHSLLVTIVGVQVLLVFPIVEMVLALIIAKAITPKLRRMKLINHEDPLLIAKIEKDYIQGLYNIINRVLGTNITRPQKPYREGRQVQ